MDGTSNKKINMPNSVLEGGKFWINIMQGRELESARGWDALSITGIEKVSVEGYLGAKA